MLQAGGGDFASCVGAIRRDGRALPSGAMAQSHTGCKQRTPKMALTASQDDRNAYAKLGGAMDNLSDGYAYVVKAISATDDARDPLTKTDRLAKFAKVTSKAQKAYSYARKIQELLDEKTRDGAILKLGVKISIDLAGKVLGSGLSGHPYYTYHKAMLDALADVLNSHRNSRAAVDQYRKAVTAANSAAVAAEFKRLESRKVRIVSDHWAFSATIGVAADLARGMYAESLARKKLQEYGDARLLQSITDLETWRANWAGLSFDVMKLQIMTGNELNAATGAMNKVKDLMATLMRGNNPSRVAGYAASNNIDWEKYDQIVNQKKPDLLMNDPVKFAQGNCDKAAAWANAFTEMCDFVRTEEVIFSSRFNKQLERLNKVLYG
jgi:hypothetical protein